MVSFQTLRPARREIMRFAGLWATGLLQPNRATVLQSRLMNGDDWMTTQDAAELSGYHVNYIRKLIRRGELRARKISFLWFVHRPSLLEYIAQAEKSDDKRRGPKV